MNSLLYVEQSLSPDEKIMHVGRFHWIYVAIAFFWLAIGVVGFLAILFGAMVFDVHTDIQEQFRGLPSSMYWNAWSEVVARKGGYFALFGHIHVAVRIAAFVVLLMGVAMFSHMMVRRATTEIAITTKRLVLKEGLVARRVDEMNIDRIESVHVYQSVLGRLCDFGVVMVRGMGIGEIVLPVLAEPVKIRRKIEKAKYVNESRNTW